MKSLIVELKELDYLFINRRYADAVEFLGGLLDKYKAPEEIAMILRERAGYYRILKQYDKALEDLLIIQNKLAPVISDCVNAGELLIGRSEYSLALKYINRGIILSDNLNDMYYISTLLFMRALVYIKLNNYSEAKEILNNIDPFSEFWIDRTLPYTRDELLDVIRGNE